MSDGLQQLISDLSMRMPAMPKPPPNAATDWSEFEVQLYYSSGGAIKPKPKPKVAPSPSPPSTASTATVSTTVAATHTAQPVTTPPAPISPASPTSAGFSGSGRLPFPKKDVISRPPSAPPAHVTHKVIYIEHTDTYQIIFNSHYLSFCLHAIQDFYGNALLIDLLRTNGLRMNVIHMDGLRCLMSGIMGDHLDVFSTAVEKTESTVTWYHAIQPSGGGALLADCLLTVGFFETSGAQVPLPAAVLQKAHPEGKVMVRGVLKKRTTPPPLGARLQTFAATAWQDSVDLTGCLDPAFVLKLFERGRTNFIGGADGLKQLLDGGIKCVVFRVEGVQFHPHRSHEVVGQQLEVRTRGSPAEQMIVFHQEVWSPGAASPVAEGVVVCLNLDAATGEKISPESRLELRRLFEGA
eukprot:GGOE01046200.1.p1 GENE.GGOE01046200.1~~GGOE01046200.1.p1  ORF type:complete len:423 (+),score=127.45 GGOE01046200.1:44-1270(+)